MSHGQIICLYDTPSVTHTHTGTKHVVLLALATYTFSISVFSPLLVGLNG